MRLQESWVAAVAAGLSLLILAGPASGQTDRERIEVTIVEVPVTVVHDGQPVRGLTRENFEIHDRGRKKEITHFDVVDFGSDAGVPAGTRSALPPAARRNLMLLFDLTNSTPGSLVRVRQAAVDFVSRELLPQDRVSVATIGAQSGFELITGFTTDRELAVAAIETFGLPQFFTMRDPLRLAATDQWMLDVLKDDPLYEEAVRVMNLTQAVAREAQRHQVTREIAYFTALGRALDRVAGRKHVILLSEGFDPQVLRGRESLLSADSLRERESALRGRVWEIDTDDMYGNARAGTELRQMIDVLRRSDVVLHAIDIKGLRTDVDSREGLQPASNESLFMLTRDTGGEVFRNANRLGEHFQRFLKSQEVTYILGFRGESSSPGAFHSLRVRVVKGPGGARVNHRVGYYEPAPAESDLDRQLTAGEIIMNRLPAADIRLNALVTPFLRSDGVADVPVIVDVEGRSLVEGVSGGILPIEFFIYAFDEHESIRDHVYQRATLDLGLLRERLLGGGTKFYHTLRLPPGDYSVRVLVRVAETRNGFTDVDLTVPSTGQRVVAPLVLDDASRRVMIRGSSRPGVSPEYPFQAGETVFVPAAAPVFASGATGEFALFIFNAPENVEAVARIEGGAGGQPAEARLLGRTQDEGGLQKLLLSVDTRPLARGAYSLVVTLRDSGGLLDERVWMPVSIQ